MILQKWNWKKHIYEDYSVPNYYNVKCYSNDMKEIVHCPHCGDELEFGETYNSLEIHTPCTGFGYGVCESCYQDEWARRKESKR